MRLDHLSYASPPEELDSCAQKLGEQLGVEPVDGGLHPRFGTRNRVLPLANGHYVEVVAVLDHPVVDQVPFGQAVKARAESGAGWLGWVVAVEDLTALEARLGRAAVEGHRTRPDGVELRWRQLGVKGLMNDPALPFFVQWVSSPSEHPSNGGTSTRLERLQMGGDPSRVSDWLGAPVAKPLTDIDVDWTAPNGQPGLLSATFSTPSGVVTI
ncbi:MAG TPA: VOC family protein [Jiangellaceae bacterium]|nr:VOC family protein [Jiangellaceae bacterium]